MRTVLQETINSIRGKMADVVQAGSYAVILNTVELQIILDASELSEPLQERCELLGRALTAIWGLVSEEDRQEITALLDVPAGSGKTAPALTIVQMLERKGAAMEEV